MSRARAKRKRRRRAREQAGGRAAEGTAGGGGGRAAEGTAGGGGGRAAERTAGGGGGASKPPAPPAPVTPAAPVAPVAPRPSRFEIRAGVARPQPIWAPFPLTEIGMAAGLAIFVAGVLSDGRRESWLLSVAVLMLVVVVVELCLREHFGGFRSHTLLLAVLPVAILNGLAVVAAGDGWTGPPVLAADVALAGALAWLLQRGFRAAHERAAGAARQ